MSKIIKGRGRIEGNSSAPSSSYRTTNPKAGFSRSSGSGRIFSNEELQLRQKAQELVQQAQAQAIQLREQAPEYQQRGYEDGYLKGDEDGKRELIELILRLNRENEAKFYHFEGEVRRLALQIVEKIIGSSMPLDSQYLNQIVKEEFSKISLGQKVFFYVNPDDYSQLEANQPELLAEIGRAWDIQLQPSQDISPQTCKVEMESGIIETSLETSLQALRNILLGE